MYLQSLKPSQTGCINGSLKRRISWHISMKQVGGFLAKRTLLLCSWLCLQGSQNGLRMCQHSSHGYRRYNYCYYCCFSCGKKVWMKNCLGKVNYLGKIRIRVVFGSCQNNNHTVQLWRMLLWDFMAKIHDWQNGCWEDLWELHGTQSLQPRVSQLLMGSVQWLKSAEFSIPGWLC